MNDEQERLMEVFNEARTKASIEERDAYLAAECGSDEALRRQVETLLKAHTNLGDFLKPPSDDPAITEGPGTVIGRYKLLEQIGEGGFGVVFMAEQVEPIRRKVALKIVKPGMDTKQVIARFEAERQALAMMDHPNIARVFDAGATGSGRPYFVMELVQGVPLTRFCDANELSPPERLQLIMQVCRAVQHAHQKGVIHRDLKPSNILVTLHDGKPVPKVIDFGTAKALLQPLTEKTLFTAYGGLIGTPQYMSPEQAELSGLDVDTRADIYSLGVLLYELLTGTTPFEIERLRAAAFEEMMRIIRQEDPPKPSTRVSTLGERATEIAKHRHMDANLLRRSLKGDLDWIVMKTLEKDRARRYETAAGLADDLQRHLDHQPVQAGPPGAGYRVGKFVRRHAWGTAVAAAAALLLGLSTVLVWRSQRVTAAALQRTKFALATAEEQRTLAAARQQEAEQQRGLATAAAAREREAAEQERQAREAAVRAEHEAMLRLADNYTSRGFEGGNTTRNAWAALWFATAAVTSRDDPERAQANLVRVNNWLHGQCTPVAAVGQAENGGDQLTFDPANSRYLITYKRHGGVEAPPQIWDLATEQPLHPPVGFDSLGDAVWAAGGQVLLGSSNGLVALASVPDLKILHQWHAGGAVKRVAASPDGRIVAATCGTKLLAWTVSGNADPAIVEHPAAIAYIGFSPKGEYLVTATDDQSKASVFAVETNGSTSPLLRQTLGPVAHIYRKSSADPSQYFARPPVFVNGGRELVTIPGQGEINWYDTASGTLLTNTQDNHLNYIRSLAVSPGGLTVALGRALYNMSTRKLIQSFGNTQSQAFGPDGSLLANSDDNITVYRITQNTIASQAFPIISTRGFPAFSNDGKYMAVLNGGVVRVWRIPATASNTNIVHSVRLDGQSTWAAFSPDGQYVAPIGNTKGTTVRTIQVCAAATGKPAGKALPLGADLVSADFSPDSQLIAALTGIHGDKRQLRIWNWQTGSLVCPPFPLDSEPVWVSFAPDGKAVAVHCINGTALLIDPATGGELLRVQCRATRTEGTYPWMTGRGTIGFSHDGRTLYTWGSAVVQAWDRATGRERFAVRHGRACWAVAESPDGRVLATAGDDGFLCFWNAANGNALHPPIEHPDQVLNVAFSPDGRLVATACGDLLIRVWDVSTGNLAFAMSPGGWPTSVRFTPDGRFVITGDALGIQLWDSKTGNSVSRHISTGDSQLPQLDLSRDGNLAVISGDARFFSIVDLQPLTVVSKSSPEEAMLWTELLSNSRIDGSVIVNLTNAEWLERWREYRRQHPEFRPLAEDNLP